MTQPIVPRAVLAWLLGAGWLWMVVGWTVWGSSACAGCSGGAAWEVVASSPFLMVLFVFPYNLFLPLFAGTQSYPASFGVILAICGLIALAGWRILPPRLSFLHLVLVAVIWAGACAAGVGLIMSGTHIP